MGGLKLRGSSKLVNYRDFWGLTSNSGTPIRLASPMEKWKGSIIDTPTVALLNQQSQCATNSMQISTTTRSRISVLGNLCKTTSIRMKHTRITSQDNQTRARRIPVLQMRSRQHWTILRICHNSKKYISAVNMKEERR